MVRNLFLAGGLAAATTVVHGLCTAGALEAIRRFHPRDISTAFARVSILTMLVVLMGAAVVVEASLWALVYSAVGALDGFEPALYFSIVTYTTLGYGDVVLPPDWRLLGAMQAANGTIMFGWTTALIVAAVHQLYLHRGDASDRSPASV